MSEAIMAEKLTDFDMRNKLLLQKQKNNQLFEGLDDLKDCTFHPKITKLGKQMPQKTAVDRAYGDKLKQELAKEHAMLYW